MEYKFRYIDVEMEGGYAQISVFIPPEGEGILNVKYFGNTPQGVRKGFEERLRSNLNLNAIYEKGALLN
mgnify:CR=1 FL=1